MTRHSRTVVAYPPEPGRRAVTVSLEVGAVEAFLIEEDLLCFTTFALMAYSFQHKATDESSFTCSALRS
jgi:hypothetical protein